MTTNNLDMTPGASPAGSTLDAPATEPDSVESEGSTEGAIPEGDNLSEGGHKALAAERTARREAERKARDLQAELEAIRTEALRRDVAEATGMTEAQAKFLTGETREELEAHAKELLDAFQPSPHLSPSARPVEDLKSGTDPDRAPTPNYGAVADRVMGRGI